MEDPKIEVTTKDGVPCIIAHFSKEFAEKQGSNCGFIKESYFTVIATRDRMCGNTGIRTVDRIQPLHKYNLCIGDSLYGPLLPIFKQWVEEYLHGNLPKFEEPLPSRFRAIMEELTGE